MNGLAECLWLAADEVLMMTTEASQFPSTLPVPAVWCQSPPHDLDRDGLETAVASISCL